MAIYGPYDHPPISGLHLSPMITRPQPTSTHRRVIIDLSWSLGQSVNAPLSSSIHVNFVCSLPYPTIDAMVQAAVAADNNGTCFIFKVDLEHAFGNLRVDPNDYALLGLGWHGRYYLDCGIPFGLKSGSFFCQLATDGIRHIMAQHGFELYNYSDDQIVICPDWETACQAYLF